MNSVHNKGNIPKYRHCIQSVDIHMAVVDGVLGKEQCGDCMVRVKTAGQKFALRQENYKICSSTYLLVAIGVSPV